MSRIDHFIRVDVSMAGLLSVLFRKKVFMIITPS